MEPYRIGIRIFSLTLMVAVMAASGAPSARSDGKQKQDSLRTLEIILKSEMRMKNKVLILKEKGFSDSLLGKRSKPGWEEFNQVLNDSSRARVVANGDEFKAYWSKIERQNGINELRSQYAGQDIDKSRIPKMYLFDSSVVIYPGWIILRRK